MRMLRRFCSLCLQTIWNWKDGRKGCFTVKLKLVFPALLAFVLSVVPAGAEAPFHIGIMTGTVSQSEDSLRGAELMLERYGNSSEGGMITHVTYPDNFMSEMEVTIGQLVGLADDPKMKAIVVNQAVPGTAEAFRRIRERRSDILLLAGNIQEDPAVVTAAADIAVNGDDISRGYLIPLAAKKLGAKTFVHISFPRHMSYETLARRRAVMEEACRDLGMKFVFETSPDPTSDVGVAGAQQFILEKLPAWLEQYGKDTAFFCTNDSQREPMLKRIAECGGYFVESDSPLIYSGALGIDLSQERGDWPALLGKIERVIVDAGQGGRMASWAYSIDYTCSVALTGFARKVLEGKAKVDNVRELMNCFTEATPGVGWNSSYYTDAGTGVRNRKLVMVYEDTYVFGRGFLGMTEVDVPEKYFRIK